MTDADEPEERPTGRVVELVDVVAGVLERGPGLGSTRLICIDGPSGAGKTTLAARLRVVARSLTSVPVRVVHMDALYDGWHGLADAASRRVPEWLLTPLAADLPGRYRRYDWHRGGYAEWHEVPVGSLLVLEGCGSAARPADSFASVRLWVDADAAVRRRRGMDRSGPAVLPYLQAWAVDEDAHFAADDTRARADLHVLGDPGIACDPATQIVVTDAPAA